jgi:hypothetical protein
VVVGACGALATSAGFFAFSDQAELLVNLAALQKRLTGIPACSLRLVLPASGDRRNCLQHNTISEQRGNVRVIVRGRNLDDVDPEDR